MAGVDTTERRTTSPEGHAKPPGDYPRWDDYMLDVEQAATVEWDRTLSLKLTKAMRLAPNSTVYRALLEDERVPIAAMDQNWARRYGLL